MADEVDKFVLQYNVDLKDSITKLEQLHDKMETANKKSKEAPLSVSKSVKEAVGHLDNLIPGLGKASDGALKIAGVFKGWSTPIMVATTALMAMAYAIKQVNLLRNEYNEQRQTAWNTGMSPIDVEQTQREFNAASGGRMTGAQSRSLMENIQSKIQAAYVDPNPANAGSLALQMAGTSAYSSNGQMNSTSNALDEIGRKMRSVSQEQANAIGQTLGLTQNETMAIRERNDAVIDANKLSADEVRRRVESNAAMESLNASFGTIDEAFRRTGNIIGEAFMPIFSEIMSAIAEWLQKLPGDLDKSITAFRQFNETFSLFMQDIQDPKKVFTGKVSWEKDSEQAAAMLAKQNEAAQKAAAKQSDAAQTQKQTAADNEKAIKLFSQSVNSMAGVVDEQQAWAAWAGSVGKAGGLKGLGEGAAGAANDSGGGNGAQYGGYTSPPPQAGASTVYNTGNIRSMDGGFRTFNNYSEGMMAQGNQLLRYFNGKTTGRDLQSINDIISTWAPKSENKTGAYIQFMENSMKMKGTDKLNFDDPKVLGEFMYYQAVYEKGADAMKQFKMADFQRAAQNLKAGGGPITPQSTQIAMSSVYQHEDINAGMHASSRANLRLQEVFESVANVIGGGMSAAQMRNGGALKSDIQWGLNKDMFDTNRSVNTLKMQLNSPQLERNRAQYANELLRAEQHLQALRTNYNTVLGVGTGSADGPRGITIQRPVYNITVNGGPQPQQTANAIKVALDQHNSDLVNQHNSVISH